MLLRSNRSADLDKMPTVLEMSVCRLIISDFGSLHLEMEAKTRLNAIAISANGPRTDHNAQQTYASGRSISYEYLSNFCRPCEGFDGWQSCPAMSFLMYDHATVYSLNLYIWNANETSTVSYDCMTSLSKLLTEPYVSHANELDEICAVKWQSSNKFH